MSDVQNSDSSSIAKNPKVLPILAVCAGQTLWGFSYIFTKMASETSTVEQLLLIRFIIAFLIMNLLILTGKFKISLKGKHIRWLFWLGILDPIYFYCETYGIVYTNATFSGVMLSVVPVISIVLAALLLKEYPTKRQVAFCFLPIIGVIIITIADSELGVITFIGVVLLIFTGLDSAFYKIINRKSSSEFSSFERTYFVLLVSSIFYTFRALSQANWDFGTYISPMSQPKFVFAVLMLSVFCSVFANLFVNYAAGKLSVAKLSTFGTLTTL